eukprot:2729327-Amphidinium_carterae.1
MDGKGRLSSNPDVNRFGLDPAWKHFSAFRAWEKLELELSLLGAGTHLAGAEPCIAGHKHGDVLEHSQPCVAQATPCGPCLCLQVEACIIGPNIGTRRNAASFWPELPTPASAQARLGFRPPNLRWTNVPLGTKLIQREKLLVYHEAIGRYLVSPPFLLRGLGVVRQGVACTFL